MKEGKGKREVQSKEHFDNRVMEENRRRQIGTVDWAELRQTESEYNQGGTRKALGRRWVLGK